MNETWPEIKKRKLKERRGETFDWIQSLVVALFACVLIFTFLVRVVGVVGTSMLNTLHPGDQGSQGRQPVRFDRGGLGACQGHARPVYG